MMVFEQDDKKSIGNTRGRMQIMADILHHCTDNNKKKSHVMQKANLNLDQVNHYLGNLLSKGLLELAIAEGIRIYRTTEKGREFLNYHYDMMQLFKDHVNNNNNKKQNKNKNGRTNLLNEEGESNYLTVKTRKKILSVSFLLAITISMLVSTSMQTITAAATTTTLFQQKQRLAYAQEEDIGKDKLEQEGRGDITATIESKDVAEANHVEVANEEEEEEWEAADNGQSDTNNNDGNQLQGTTRNQTDRGEEEDDSEPDTSDQPTIKEEDLQTIEESETEQQRRDYPDDDCLFDPSLPKCAPEDGKCPAGFAMNENGQCYPRKPCPPGFERRDDDETGTCHPTVENNLRIMVTIKRADGPGEISVRSETTSKIISKTVSNIKGTHTFNFEKGQVPVGGRFTACADSDVLKQELCTRGKNGEEREPEKVTITFPTSERGLKVIVTVKRADGPGEISVRSGETDKTLRRTVDNLEGKYIFNFKAGEVPANGVFEACANSDVLKLAKRCVTRVNGPEKEPEAVTIRF